MATQIGKGHIFSLSGAAVGIASLSGYVSPNLSTLRPSHSVNVDEIPDQTGEIGSVIFSGDAIELDIDFIPEGSSIANAKLSAGAPIAGAGVTLTGLPIIACGPFSDALNTNAGNTQPWVYMGGWNPSLTSTGKVTNVIKLKRWFNITSATAIT